MSMDIPNSFQHTADDARDGEGTIITVVPSHELRVLMQSVSDGPCSGEVRVISDFMEQVTALFELTIFSAFASRENAAGAMACMSLGLTALAAEVVGESVKTCDCDGCQARREGGD